MSNYPVIPGMEHALGYLNPEKPTAHLVECKLPFVQDIATDVHQCKCKVNINLGTTRALCSQQ